MLSNLSVSRKASPDVSASRPAYEAIMAANSEVMQSIHAVRDSMDAVLGATVVLYNTGDFSSIEAMAPGVARLKAEIARLVAAADALDAEVGSYL